jgi:hypothetical protein
MFATGTKEKHTSITHWSWVCAKHIKILMYSVLYCVNTNMHMTYNTQITDLISQTVTASLRRKHGMV